MNQDLEKTNINVGNRCVHLHSDASNTKSVHSMRTSLPPPNVSPWRKIIISLIYGNSPGPTWNHCTYKMSFLIIKYIERFMQTLSTSINSGDINLLTRLWLRLDLQKATSLRHAYANRVQSEETKKEKNPDIFHTVQTIG